MSAEPPIDELALPLAIRINNLLTNNEPDKLHRYFDLPPDFCLEMCQRFYRTACDVHSLIRSEEKKGSPLESLRDHWEIARKHMVAEVVREMANHG